MKSFFKFQYITKKFATKIRNPNFLKDFNLSRKEIKELNNQLKEPWVKPGWDKIVINKNNFRLDFIFFHVQELL